MHVRGIAAPKLDYRRPESVATPVENCPLLLISLKRLITSAIPCTASSFVRKLNERK